MDAASRRRRIADFSHRHRRRAHRLGRRAAISSGQPFHQHIITLVFRHHRPDTGRNCRLFQRTAQKFPFIKRDNIKIIPLAVCMFALIGAIAVWFPEILGNGKAGNQLTFGGLTDWQHSLELTAVKWLVVLMALAAGAYGGLITPSMMLGSTIAFAAAAAWNTFFPAMSSESAAVVGAAVFLGVSLKMPLTAIAFILELTYAHVALLMPLCTGMAGAVWVAKKMGFK